MIPKIARWAGIDRDPSGLYTTLGPGNSNCRRRGILIVANDRGLYHAWFRTSLADGLISNRLDNCPIVRGKKRACVRRSRYQPKRSCRMPNGDASVRRNGRAISPDPRLQPSISLVLHGAREPIEPSGAGRMAPFACEHGFDIPQGIGRGPWVDREVRGQARCDSIRKRRSAFRPNAPRMSQTTRHRNLAINFE
jgi:hypothetical protein